MADASSSFFASLAERGHDPVLGGIAGTVRVDLVDGARTRSWQVAMDRGAIVVTDGGGDADCVIRTDGETFDQLVTGRIAAMAATLRGALEVDGDPRLLVRFQRLFPPPTGMPAAAAGRSTGRRRE